MRIKEEFNLSHLFDCGFVVPKNEVTVDGLELSNYDYYYEISQTENQLCRYLLVKNRKIYI